MADRFALASIDAWLADMRNVIVVRAPELLQLFEIYAVEARFGRQYIENELKHTPPGAQILEVGAGSLLLSCQLVREGFNVTALEPIGSGFSHFGQLRALVLAQAQQLGFSPKVLDLPAEELSIADAFDFAFSVNVMEHVTDVATCLSRIGASLKLGASYRFTCPNYLFPYEPHFNIPTLLSKRLTEQWLGKKLFSNKLLTDPRGTWESLNWINVLLVRRAAKQVPGLHVTFNRKMLVSALERVATDKKFASRRANWMRVVILILVRTRLHRVAELIPTLFQPVIDCLIIRTAPKESR